MNMNYEQAWQLALDDVPVVHDWEEATLHGWDEEEVIFGAVQDAAFRAACDHNAMDLYLKWSRGYKEVYKEVMSRTEPFWF